MTTASVAVRARLMGVDQMAPAFRPVRIPTHPLRGAQWHLGRATGHVLELRLD
jgi:hypothetical protein